MDPRRFVNAAVWLVVALACVARAEPVHAPEHLVASAIEARLLKVASRGALLVDGERFTATGELKALYAQHDFAPQWSIERASVLAEVLLQADREGLRPDDYLVGPVTVRVLRLSDGTHPPEAWAEADLLFSEALARYVRHLLVGKVDPKRIEATWNLPDDHELFPGSLHDALDATDLRVWLARLTPSHWLYVGLRKGLASLRSIKAQGGWGRVKPGPKRVPGDHDVRMPSLRDRLTVSKELPADAPVPEDPTLFDEALGAALVSFRQVHGLSAEPLLDAAAVAALNVPVERRIDQVRVNLDRGRVVLERLDQTFVVVNIAGFRLFYVRDGEVAWETRVQVGKHERETPIFRSEIDEVVFNPSWTVPPTILRKDVLPAARTGTAIFKRKGLEVIAPDGTRVDPATVDWSAWTARTLPYRLVQPPGDANALGRVKLNFPNPYLVYLHDTPSQALFEKDVRTFSSGCIRVQDPRTLARIVLADPAWDDVAIAAATTGDKRLTVKVQRPIPLLVLYWTAAADREGRWRFYADPYDRDRKYLKALDAPLSRTRR